MMKLRPILIALAAVMAGPQGTARADEGAVRISFIKAGWVIGGTIGSGAKWFSPIQPVTNGTSDSQNRRCRFAQSIEPSTCSTAWTRW